MKQAGTFKKILNYIRKYWFMVAMSIVLATVTVVLTLYIPILTGDAVDLIVEKGNVDMVGILANVCTKCAEYDINVMEVSQSVLQDLFAMTMLVDITNSKVEFSVMAEAMEKIGEEMGLKVYVMHEDIFNSMHRI